MRGNNNCIKNILCVCLPWLDAVVAAEAIVRSVFTAIIVGKVLAKVTTKASNRPLSGAMPQPRFPTEKKIGQITASAEPGRAKAMTPH